MNPVPEPPMSAACEVGVPTFCSPTPECSSSSADCVAATPNVLGPCVCHIAGLQRVGPTEFAEVTAGDFGGGNFYSAQYHFISAASWCSIAVGPIGAGGQVIVPMVRGRISALRVTADAIYVSTTAPSAALAFSLAGEPLTAPSAEVALPVQTPRTTLMVDGLYLDGTKISEKPWSFYETPDGVYVIEETNTGQLLYVPFADPASRRPVAMSGVSAFSGVWASGTDVYVSVLQQDRETYELDYIDLSVVGK